MDSSTFTVKWVVFSARIFKITLNLQFHNGFIQFVIETCEIFPYNLNIQPNHCIIVLALLIKMARLWLLVLVSLAVFCDNPEAGTIRVERDIASCQEVVKKHSACT